jgi:hypothetical protein
MKTNTLTLAALLALTPIQAFAQAQANDTAYEKKSYNYAEWRKGDFPKLLLCATQARSFTWAG